MTDPAMFRVRNWQKFQHYSKRNPPWIKLHFSILSSEDWVTLDDASRVLAVACMLIASRNGGEVPANGDYLKRVAYLNKPPNFKPLIDCGFLECASTMLADASAMLANACSETETETETKGAKAPVFDPASIPGLDAAAWSEWVEHRRSIRKPIKNPEKAAKEMAAYGAGQRAAVDRSIAAGYQGLFAPTSVPAKTNGSKGPYRDSDI